MKIAVIGGTGVYDPNMLSDIRDIQLTTPYGEASGIVGTFEGSEIIFLPRHGQKHSVPPHKVNYRANIAGLKSAGVTHVISTGAVGSLNEDMGPGNFVIIDQFLDFTKTRESTFFDGGSMGVVHADCTEPYCNEIRKILLEAAKSLNLTAHSKGCYVCTEGPRFETPAEIRAYRILGGDVVGMTNVPEVVLAREAGICYATACIVTNFAAGISRAPLSHDEVLLEMKQRQEDLKNLIAKSLSLLLSSEGTDCNCPEPPQSILV